MSWRPRGFGYQCAFVIVAAAFLIVPARAQQANIRSVVFYTVKRDRVTDFLAASKEFTAVMAKGGSDRSFSMWESLTGANEYARVVTFTKWADLDRGSEPKMKEQIAELTSIGTRISQCIESSHRVIEEVLPDSSLPQSGDLPKMIRVLRTRVRPDKVGEYLALINADALPAVKKAGWKNYTVAQERFGAPTSEFITVAPMNNWADVDGGFGLHQKTMSAEEYQRFLAKLRALTVENEYNTYRLVPESSYQPAK
jgi:hypothetical protein